jgi:hypothetical protein
MTHVLADTIPTQADPAPTVPGETAQPETVLNHILTFLLPFFLTGAAGDVRLARISALQMLDAYASTSGKELMLAAQIIAFGFSTLDALAKAVVEPDLSPSARLRHRGNANALHRAGEQCRKALDRSRHPSAVVKTMCLDTGPPAADTAVQDVRTAMQKMQQAIVEAAPSLAQRLSNEAQPISRQQRRYLARKAEERLLQQEREARKAARIKQLAGTRASASSGPQPLAAASDVVSPQ